MTKADREDVSDDALLPFVDAWSIDIEAPPRVVWATSGWNLTAKTGREICSNQATGEFGLDAEATKPSRVASKRSPRLIQNCISSPVVKL